MESADWERWQMWSAIKNSTFQLGSQISKIELSSVIHLPTRSNTAPAAAGGDGRGGHTPAPLVRRRAQEVGRQRCRRPRVVPIHCTVERAPLGHGRRAPRMAGGGSTCGPHSAWPGYMCCRACTAESTAQPFTSSASLKARVQWRAAATARTDATELWAPGALRLPLSGSTTHAQSQR